MVDKPRDPTDFSDLEAKENERRKAMGLPPLPKRTWKHMSKYTEEDIEEYMAEVRETAKTLHRDQKKQMAYIEKSRRNLLAQVYGSALNKKVKPKPTDKVVIVGPSGAASATVEDVVESVVSTREKARERDLDEAVTAAIEGKTKGGKKKKVKKQKFDNESDTFEGDVFRQAFPILSQVVESLKGNRHEGGVEKSREFLRGRRTLSQTESMAESLKSLTGEQKKSVDLLGQLLNVAKGLGPRAGSTPGSQSGLNISAESSGRSGRGGDLMRRAAPYALGAAAVGAVGYGAYSMLGDGESSQGTEPVPPPAAIPYGADVDGMGLRPEAAAPPPPATPAVTPQPSESFGRQFIAARDARATAEQELASFRERAGQASVRPHSNPVLRAFSDEEYYENPEDNERFQELQRRANQTRRQEERIQRQHQFSVVGVQPSSSGLDRGMGPEGDLASPNLNQMARMVEILKSRYGYTDDQLQSLPGLRGNFIEINGKRYPSSIVGLFNRLANEELAQSADTAMASDDATAVATAMGEIQPAGPSITPTESPATTPAAPTTAVTPRISSGRQSRITRPRTLPTLGEGGDLAAGFAGGADASGMGLEPAAAQRERPRTIADAQRLWPRGHVEDLSGLVRSRLTAASQPERFEEVMEAMIKLRPNGLSRSNFANESLLRDYLIANPGRRTEANELMERAGQAMESGGQEIQRLLEQQKDGSAPSDLARPVSDRRSMTKDPLDPSAFIGSDLLLKARKVTFKGDEIEFLSGSSPMGKGSVGGFGGPPPMFGGGGAPSTGGGGGQVEGGGSQAIPGGEQTGDTSSLTFAPGVDPRIKKEVAQKIQQVESAFGKKLTITSGFRDQSRNAAAGGAKNSAHTRANAVDIRFSGNEEDTVKLIEAASAAGIGGIGVYRPGWLHLDTESKRVWGPDFSARSVPEWAKPALEAHLSGKQQDGQAVGTEAPTTSMSAEPSAAGGGAGGGEGSGSSQLTTGSASAAGSAPTDGIQVATASQENAMAERTPTAPSVVIPETPTTGQGSPGSATSATLNSPDDPGPIEPPDAAERYAMLFNMAA